MQNKIPSRNCAMSTAEKLVNFRKFKDLKDVSFYKLSFSEQFLFNNTSLVFEIQISLKLLYRFIENFIYFL
jgi:hypothetical protein